MDRYLNQLAEDFRDSASEVPTSDEMRQRFNIEIPKEFEMFAYAELYLRLPAQKLSAILGIEKAVLPPPERLTRKQTAYLYGEIIQLLRAYHFHPVFPMNLPIHIRYQVLYSHWNQKHVFMGEGTVHIEFCDYEQIRCPFPKTFCECRKFSEEA